MNQWIHTLPDGALDIVGDVHGEWAALQQLLHHLGYDERGRHPAGRRLVLVGDVCDRGPDSPAVMAWLREVMPHGHISAILGNHELNLLLDDPKDGAGWYFPQQEAVDAAFYEPFARMTDAADKAAVREMLQQWPLVLERSDIRIVHAAWLPESVAALRALPGGSVAQWFQRYEADALTYAESQPWFADYQAEQAAHATQLWDAGADMPLLAASARFELNRVNFNPIRALTSGIEEAIDSPFFASGRWRFTGRCAWWRHYHDPIPVVMGHYWRQWSAEAPLNKARRVLFPEPGNAWLGPTGQVFCIDFSVGARWRERQAGVTASPSRYRLAALRWPERVLVFDSGEVARTVGKV